jgi:hypothetical protein
VGQPALTLLLAALALAAYFALGLWAPWKESDYPGLWLILTGVCAYAALWFGLPLGR